MIGASHLTHPVLLSGRDHPPGAASTAFARLRMPGLCRILWTGDSSLVATSDERNAKGERGFLRLPAPMLDYWDGED